MSIITFDVALFRSQFPEFANETNFPDATLKGYFNLSTCYLSTDDYGWLAGDCRLRALNLMTAHLCQIRQLTIKGQTSGVATNASVGSVSISLTPPPFGSNNWSWWLSTTPYGQELLSLLKSASIGGLYIGGRPERSAFRKVGGRF